MLGGGLLRAHCCFLLSIYPIESIFWLPHLVALKLMPESSQISMILFRCPSFGRNPCRIIFAIFISSMLFGAKWKPITDEEWALEECSLDSGADVEILLKYAESDYFHEDEAYQAYYLRYKVYSEKGVDVLSTYRESSSSTLSKLSNDHARIYKPDGRVVEISNTDAQKRGGSGKEKTILFDLQGLEPGDIVDVQYRINMLARVYSTGFYTAFRDDFPTRKRVIRVRPSPRVIQYPYVRWFTQNAKPLEVEKKGDGFYEAQIENIRAYVEEPYSLLPRAWTPGFHFYMVNTGRPAHEYWKQEGKALFRKMKQATSSGKRTQRVAEELLEEASSDVEKLRVIYRFCVTELKNSKYGEPGPISDEDLARIKDDATVEEVLKQGFGNPKNINTAFYGLARFAGFDAQTVALRSKVSYPFSVAFTSIDGVLPYRCIGVEIDGKWEYFNPGEKYHGFGQLSWWNQGVVALIAGKGGMKRQSIKNSSPDYSNVKSIAKLELSERGELSGSVTFEYSGHYALQLKHALDGKVESERIEL